PEIVSKSLAKLPIPKRMRWGASDIEFVRPVHWLVMMLGSDVIEGEVLGLTSGNTTMGHRFHHPDAITIRQASSYAEQLREQGHVIASFSERRDEVRKQAEASAKALGGVAHIEDALLDEVTALVELPIAVSGNFDKAFLDIPQECLISSMQDHQKYFPVVDSKGALLPHFITTSNIKSSKPEVVQQGNERVINPRFSDAKFFWDQDCKVKLESRREATKKIIFQQKLGTLYEKTERVASLAGFIADTLSSEKGSENGANKKDAIRAAELSKCDLSSEMVNEFAELQGIMGRYYATKDGETSDVANAMHEQYQPGFAGDVIPAGMTGKILSLADKLDTLMGIFAIDMKPTGSKDPFSLRRAALGAQRIIIEGKLNLNLKDLLKQAAKGLSDKVDASNAVDDTFKFIMERLTAYYKDQGIDAETVASVASLRPTYPLDFDHRVKAVAEFKALPQAESLAAANKRISNILKKVEGKISDTVDESLFQEPQEKALYQSVQAQQQKVEPLFAKGDYSSALTSLAGLKDDVDAFFDGVMVMADNEDLKNNRLALLSQLRNLFLNIADLSRL
ncbi:MAG TPA: glycine--tRNA ligase subunit beta, partial [Leucothrix sp.]|nr:glycine--tRNA ligase subunit beta [Leucothrix sp.]